MRRVYGARSFEEEKAAILKACSDMKLDASHFEGEGISSKQLLADLAHGLEIKLRSAASREVLNDEEVALACVGVSGRLLRLFSEELRADKALVLAAVKNGAQRIGYASEELRADKEVVLAAVSIDGRVLKQVSRELCGDKEVVHAAVSNDGSALRYASDEVRGDREVTLAAVNNCGQALASASEELRGDREVVLAAVSNDAQALEFASEDLRGDKAFAVLAARRAPLREPRKLYLLAGPGVTAALSADDFNAAVESKLAVPGQSEPAPTLLVTLTSLAAELTEGEADGCFRAEVMFGLSGDEFVIDLPIGTRPEEVVLEDLAEKLVAQLQEGGKLDGKQDHIYINFMSGEEVVAVAPWDSHRPLSQFLSAQTGDD